MKSSSLGVVDGRPQHSGPKYLSVIVGQRELKWNLYEIFKRPGLRRETFLFADQTAVEAEEHVGGGSSPWTFHARTAALASTADVASDPMLYGYRSLMMDWDFVDGLYRLTAADRVDYREEVIWRYDDFHRIYRPYRRLVGDGVMHGYLRWTASAASEEDDDGQRRRNATLAEYLLGLQGVGCCRDDVQPIYRPLAPWKEADEEQRMCGGGGGGGAGGTTDERRTTDWRWQDRAVESVDVTRDRHQDSLLLAASLVETPSIGETDYLH